MCESDAFDPIPASESQPPTQEILDPKWTHTYDTPLTCVKFTYHGTDWVQIAIQDKVRADDPLLSNGWIVTQVPLAVWYSAYAFVAERLPS